LDPKRRLFYGGATSAEITDRNNTRIGIQHWAKEGICGRGVLLDYVEYAKRHSIVYTTFSNHSIPLHVLLDIAKEQGVRFLRGDILFVRVGVVKEWDKQMTSTDKLAYAQSSSPQHAGLEGTEEMLRWIWNQGFAAVASDAISFEVYPPQPFYERQEGNPVKGLFMHEYLIAGWGMPIGELFDLESLACLCQEEKRWEFFITSAPLNMPGGVSSPPNCIAIF
jgi:kynurenine formamidase